MNSPILAWHQALAAKDKKRLFSLLDASCVFYSPIVFQPQKGKALAKMYLGAAYDMFSEAPDFRYVRTAEASHHAFLEFHVTIDGILVEGVDIISWNDAGKITEFKVMLRPYKAIEKVGQKMKTQLEKLNTFDKIKLGIEKQLNKLG